MNKHRSNFQASEPSIIDRIDMTQADLDRGLTAEEIARDRALLNINGFCRGLAAAVREQEVKRATETAGAA